MMTSITNIICDYYWIYTTPKYGYTDLVVVREDRKYRQ